MVFCNRCGEKTQTIVIYPKLDLRICKECGNSFHSWLTREVLESIDTQVHDLKKELVQSSKRNENLEFENTQLKATLSLLETKIHAKQSEPEPKPNKIDTAFTLQKAQNVLGEAGYIFYKKPESWGQKQKRPRIRRTRREIELAKEMELARANKNEGKK